MELAVLPQAISDFVKSINDETGDPPAKKSKVEEDEPVHKIEVIEQRDGGEHLVVLNKYEVSVRMMGSSEKLIYVPKRYPPDNHNGETFFPDRRDRDKYGDSFMGMEFPFCIPC
jgi:hypothetical protein